MKGDSASYRARYTNGIVVYGTRVPHYKADIDVKDGKTAEIAPGRSDTKRETDATGSVVAPWRSDPA